MNESTKGRVSTIISNGFNILLLLLLINGMIVIETNPEITLRAVAVVVFIQFFIRTIVYLSNSLDSLNSYLKERKKKT